MAAKRASKAKGTLYNVRLFDPEVGSFRHYARMRGTSKADVARRFLAKWAMSDDLGPSKDDISVVKATPRKKPRKIPNPRGTPRDADSLYRMERVSLDSGGYDRFGQYFGRGAPLYAVTSPDGDVFHVRGGSRAAAMANFREEYKYRHEDRHRTARFFGEKRHGNPARKKSAEKRIWRVVVARDGRSLSLASHVFETVEATTRDGATKAALRRHDHNARVVSVTAID